MIAINVVYIQLVDAVLWWSLCFMITQIWVKLCWDTWADAVIVLSSWFHFWVISGCSYTINVLIFIVVIFIVAGNDNEEEAEKEGMM